MVVGDWPCLPSTPDISRLAEPGVDPWSASGLPSSYDGVTISQNNDVDAYTQPYMVTLTINIPQMLAYIPYMDPMG